jgi:hypothetical protein
VDTANAGDAQQHNADCTTNGANNDVFCGQLSLDTKTQWSLINNNLLGLALTLFILGCVRLPQQEEETGRNDEQARCACLNSELFKEINVRSHICAKKDKRHRLCEQILCADVTLWADMVLLK